MDESAHPRTSERGVGSERLVQMLMHSFFVHHGLGSLPLLIRIVSVLVYDGFSQDAIPIVITFSLSSHERITIR